MANSSSRRNALIGWLLWSLAKRQLFKAPAEKPKPPKRRRFLRIVTAIAVLAALAGLWAKRANGRARGMDEPLA